MKLQILKRPGEPVAQVVDADTGELVEGVNEVIVRLTPEMSCALIKLVDFSANIDEVNSLVINKESI